MKILCILYWPCGALKQMSNPTISKLEFFVKLFNNIFHRKKLIIFIGKNGTTMAALKWQQVQDSIFIEHDDENNKKKYRRFLKKYKKFHITFLLDHKECTLKHEIIPILSSIIKTNPVDKFITENYKSEDIVAYSIYEINNHHGEVWNICIASSPFQKPVSNILKYVINNSFKYSGMYFLSLEFKTIIEKILQKTHNAACTNHLQIFVTITQSSDIRVIVKYKQDIMDEQIIDYPYDKSDMYIKGTIEQAVSDKLLFYKEYIKKLNLQICVIFLVDTPLKVLLSELTFDESKIIAISGNDIHTSSSNVYEEQRFQDSILIEQFDSFNTHLALNQSLKSITKLTLINSVIFKPLLAIMFGLAITLAALKYQTIVIQSKTSDLNQKYYSLSEAYREIQKRHPDLENISDLVDLYNLKNIINTTSITPLKHLKNLLSIKQSGLKITNISWNLQIPQSIDSSKRRLNITVDLIYKGQHQSMVHGIEIINGYVNHLRSVFQDYNIVYFRDTENITQIAKKVIIPANITIKEKIGGEADAG